MTQAAVETRVVVARSGFANPIALGVIVTDDSYVKVYADNTLLSEGADYEITGLGDAEGIEVEIIGAEDVDNYVGTETFTVMFDPPLDQNTSLAAGGVLGRQFESGLDQLNQRMQALGDKVSRSLRLSPNMEIDGELPWPPGDGETPIYDADSETIIWGGPAGVAAAAAAAAAASAVSAAMAEDDAEEAAAQAIAAQAAAEAAAAAAEGLPEVPTRTDLKALNPATRSLAFLAENGREGLFQWREGDYSVQVTADTAEGIYVEADDIASSVGAWVRLFDDGIQPRWFGAVGDGVADDTAAWQALADYVARVGGTIRPSIKQAYLITSMIVFQPQQGEGYSGNSPFDPPSDIWFLNKHPVLLDMNGSKMVAGAAMNAMFHFVYTGGAVDEVAPFFSKVVNGHFDGMGLADIGIHSEWCGGFDAERNRIKGVDKGIKCEGYGVHTIEKNWVQARVCFDLTEGGNDSIYIHNDMYPTEIGFHFSNAGTASIGGQLRIFSNAATNEEEGTCYFIKVEADTETDVIRNINVIDNGVAGFNALIYARGSSGTFNLKNWVVRGNNLLDYGAKASIGLIDATEIEEWTVTDNHLSPVLHTTTLDGIKLVNAVRCVIAGNTLSKVGLAAMNLGFINRCEIYGNILNNVGDSVTNTKAIRLTNASGYNNVHHNVVDQGSSSFATIGVAEESSADNNRATDNTFINVATPYQQIGSASRLGGVKSETLRAVTPTSPAAGSTTYFGANGNGSTEATQSWLMPRAGRAVKLRAEVSAAPGAAQTFTYTLRVGETDQAMTCQIAGAATFVAEDITNFVSVGANSRVTVKLVTSAGAALAGHRIYVEVVEY